MSVQAKTTVLADNLKALSSYIERTTGSEHKIEAATAATVQNRPDVDSKFDPKAVTTKTMQSSTSTDSQHEPKATPARDSPVEPVGLHSHEAHLLRRTIWGSATLWSLDLLYIILWLGMLVYVALLWRYNGTRTKSIPLDAMVLVKAAAPLSTTWSILFAATFARISTSSALWLLERGTRLGFVDMLFKSSSVSSAILSGMAAGWRGQLLLQAAGIGLALCWLLSPIGSQAVLRAPRIATVDTREAWPFSYLNVSAWNNLVGSGSDGQLALITPNTLLNAALISPLASKEAQEDIWGHVKIPSFQRMPAEKDSEGYRAVLVESSDDYTSLVGLPVGKISRAVTQKTDFAVESWTWNLTCDPWKDNDAQNEFQFNSTIGYTGSEGYDFPALRVAWNETFGVGNRATVACNISSYPVQTIIDCPSLQKRQIWFNFPGEDLSTTCDVSVNYWETGIRCNGRTCEAVRIRRSRQLHSSHAWTPLDIWTGNNAAGRLVSSLFLTNMANVVAGRNGGGGGGNALVGYISNPADPFANIGYSNGSSALADLSHDLITSRLTQFMNSYWLVSVGHQLVTGTDATFANMVDLTSPFVSPYGPTDTAETLNYSIVATATALVATTDEMLQCDTSWLSILTAINVVAVLGSVLGLVLVVISKSPRLNMDVTTMIRDNKYCGAEVDQVGSWRDDSERSALLRNLVVCLGDVRPHSTVGHVALYTSGKVVAGNLQKHRLYD